MQSYDIVQGYDQRYAKYSLKSRAHRTRTDPPQPWHNSVNVRRFFFSVNKQGEICSSMESSVEDTALFPHRHKREPKTARDSAAPRDRAAFERDTFGMTSPDSEVFQNPPSFAKLVPAGISRSKSDASCTLEPALHYYSVRPPSFPRPAPPPPADRPGQLSSSVPCTLTPVAPHRDPPS